MKKEKLILITLFTILLISPLALAQNYFIDNSIEAIKQNGASIFGPIFGHDSMDEFLFAKVLLFFLLFSVIFMTLKKIKIFTHNQVIISVVAIIVSILAVRFLKENELVNAILLPYGSLGAAISIYLPLLIFFFFVHTSVESGFGRKAGWFIYGLVFLVFWMSREYNDMGVANWLYGLGFGFAVISLFFDSSIHKYFEMGKFNEAKRLGKNAAIADIIGKIDKATKASMPQEYIDDLNERYKELVRRL